MTPADLRKAGEALYGPQWQSPLAHRLRVDARTVRRWLDGSRAISEPAAVAVELLLKHRRDA